MPRGNIRGGRNNNPTGRNQYSDCGVVDMARERPLAATAVAAGAAAAGLFLWSKRAQISQQLSGLSDQVGEWTQNRSWGETGGGNASLGATPGGGGTTASPTGRGRARSAPTS